MAEEWTRERLLQVLSVFHELDIADMIDFVFACVDNDNRTYTAQDVRSLLRALWCVAYHAVQRGEFDEAFEYLHQTTSPTPRSEDAESGQSEPE